MYDLAKVTEDANYLLNISRNEDNELKIACLKSDGNSSVWEVIYSADNNSSYIIKYYHREPENAKREFKYLSILDNHFKTERGISVPSPISLDKERKCLLMQKVSGRNVRSLLNSWHTILFKKENLSILEKAAHWLSHAQKIPMNQKFPVYGLNRINRKSFLQKSQEDEIFSRYQDEIEEIFDLFNRDRCNDQYVYCHRDFTPWNLIYGEKTLFVIDFELNCIGYPEYDPSKLYTLLAFSNYFFLRGEKLISYRNAFLKGFSNNINSYSWYFWRIKHLQSLNSRINPRDSFKNKLHNKFLRERIKFDLSTCIHSFREGLDVG